MRDLEEGVVLSQREAVRGLELLVEPPRDPRMGLEERAHGQGLSREEIKKLLPEQGDDSGEGPNARDRAKKGERKKVEAGIPLGRIASADDIAGPILFLASDLARHITGEILNVNGGSILCG